MTHREMCKKLLTLILETYASSPGMWSQTLRQEFELKIVSVYPDQEVRVFDCPFPGWDKKREGEK